MPESEIRGLSASQIQDKFALPQMARPGLNLIGLIIMIRKLVKINLLTGDYAEVDKVRLKRETHELLNYIKLHIDKNVDEHEIWKSVIPLCESVLNETVDLPIKFSELLLQHAIQEGQLPKGISELYSSFSITISGMAREILGNVDVNGVTYTYADFEY